MQTKENTASVTPNRTYKSRIFIMIFGDEKNLLELYNAMTGKHYTDPKLLTINTLDNAIFFYNGTDEQPDQRILRLSDLYTVEEKEYKLELEAVMLNVNLGHNETLMQACKTLREYAQYTARVRQYAARMPLADAVERAISECIREGILKEFLEKNRAEAKKMSIYEYDQEKHMRQEREAAWEDGVEDGREQLLQEQIRKKLAKGKSITEIADALEETEDMIRHQIEKMEETEK